MIADEIADAKAVAIAAWWCGEYADAARIYSQSMRMEAIAQRVAALHAFELAEYLVPLQIGAAIYATTEPRG